MIFVINYIRSNPTKFMDEEAMNDNLGTFFLLLLVGGIPTHLVLVFTFIDMIWNLLMWFLWKKS